MSDVEIPADLEAVFARHFPDAATTTPDPATPSSEAVGDGGDLPPAAVPQIDDGTQPLSTLPPGVTEEGLTSAETPSTLEPESPPSDSETPSPASGDGVAGQSAPSPTTYTDFDANVAFEQYMGEKPSQQKVEQLLNFYADAYALPQDRSQMVSFLMGGGDLAELAQHLNQQYGQQPTVPVTQPAAADPAWDDEDVVPPQVKAELEAIKRSQAQLAAEAEQRAVADQERERQWYADQYNAAANEWAESAPIDVPPEHLAVLKVKANKSGLFPAFLQANGGDPRRATHELLRYTAMSDPAEATRMQEAQVAAEVERRLADRNRQQLASSVSAGGNAAAAPVDTSQPLTREAAKKGAMEFLTNVMNDGQPA